MVVQLNTASVLLLLLCAAWLSNARLHLHPGAEVNAISTLKTSATGSGSEERKKVKSHIAILFGHGNSNKMAVRDKSIIIKNGKSLQSTLSSSSSSEYSRRVESKRSSRRHLWVDDKGFVAFSADYHAPRHHPPKNN